MNKEKQFQSKWGFILACVGSAVGMANVWGFPYKVGSYGGGAYLIAYLIFVAIFGYVGLSAEYAVGRKAKTGTVGAYTMALKSGNANKVLGKTIGWLPLAGSMCIAVGYAIIIAYILKSLIQSITGSLMSVDTNTWFDSFALKDFSVVPFHIIVVLITLVTLILGAESIGKTNKIMMPLFFILFLIMAVRVAILPGALEGYKFIFTVKWEAFLDPMTWIFAMGQAFFSLSITGSGMIVYGAYLPDDEDVVNGAINTAFFDTLAAFVATIVMIPACFAFGMDQAGGPKLLFVVFPKILQEMPFGRLFAVIMYLAVVFGGISSLQNMLEAVLESVNHKLPKLKRGIILAILFIICIGIGIFIEPIYKWGPWMDIVSIYIIPIGATIGAFSWFWIMKKEELMEEVNKGAKKNVGNIWHNIGKYVYAPLALIICLIALFKGISF